MLPAAKALTEEERTTCPDGHGVGVCLVVPNVDSHGDTFNSVMQQQFTW